MRRPVAGIWDVPSAGVLPALAVTAACFAAGGLVGCVLACFVDGVGGESLGVYLQVFLEAAAAQGVSAPALASLVWSTLRWPLLAVVLGFTAIGLLGLPVLFAVRGFLLGFSIACFVRAFGGAGCVLALLVFGLTGAIAVPVLFVLGVQSLIAARALASRFLGEGKRPAIYPKRYFVRCGWCAAALCVCCVLDYLVVPALLSGLAGALMLI